MLNILNLTLMLNVMREGKSESFFVHIGAVVALMDRASEF